MDHMYSRPHMQGAQLDYSYPEHLHHHLGHLHNKCQAHIQKKVKLVTVDQKVYKGVIEHVDAQNVYLIIDDGGREEEADLDYRYPPFGYGYPGYGYGYGYGYPSFGFPGFGARRLIIPLIALAALSAL